MHTNQRELQMDTSSNQLGYARVSTEEQDYTAQVDALRKLGVGGRIFAEKVSGSDKDGRPELQRLLDHVRSGDVVHVTKLDRLARSAKDALWIADHLKDKGAGLVVHDLGGMDITSDVGRMVYTVIAAVAEMERNRIRERQREGIERAKAEGRYKGRPAVLTKQKQARARELLAQGMPKARIAKELGCSRTTLYKALA